MFLPQPSTLPAGLAAIGPATGGAGGVGGRDGVSGRGSLGHVAIRAKVGKPVMVLSLESERPRFESQLDHILAVCYNSNFTLSEPKLALL